MAINIQNIIAALEAKVAAATSATETQELIVIIKSIKAAGQQTIVTYANVAALPTASTDNQGNLAFVADVGKIYYSNSTTWTEVGSGSGGAALNAGTNIVLTPETDGSITISSTGGSGGSSYDQSLNTTDDVVFNSGLIGDVSIIGNTIAGTDAYGNASNLEIVGPAIVSVESLQSDSISYNTRSCSYDVEYNLFVFGQSSYDNAEQTAFEQLGNIVPGAEVLVTGLFDSSFYMNTEVKFTVNGVTKNYDPYNPTVIQSVVFTVVPGSIYYNENGLWNPITGFKNYTRNASLQPMPGIQVSFLISSDALEVTSAGVNVNVPLTVSTINSVEDVNVNVDSRSTTTTNYTFGYAGTSTEWAFNSVQHLGTMNTDGKKLVLSSWMAGSIPVGFLEGFLPGDTLTFKRDLGAGTIGENYTVTLTSGFSYSMDQGGYVASIEELNSAMSQISLISNSNVNPVVVQTRAVGTLNSYTFGVDGALITPSLVTDSALIGDVSIIGNTIAALDSYGNADVLNVSASDVVFDSDLNLSVNTLAQTTETVSGGSERFRANFTTPYQFTFENYNSDWVNAPKFVTGSIITLTDYMNASTVVIQLTSNMVFGGMANGWMASFDVISNPSGTNSAQAYSVTVTNTSGSVANYGFDDQGTLTAPAISTDSLLINGSAPSFLTVNQDGSKSITSQGATAAIQTYENTSQMMWDTMSSYAILSDGKVKIKFANLMDSAIINYLPTLQVGDKISSPGWSTTWEVALASTFAYDMNSNGYVAEIAVDPTGFTGGYNITTSVTFTKYTAISATYTFGGDGALSASNIIADSALIGDVSIAGNTIAGIDAYGNSEKLVVDGDLEVTGDLTSPTALNVTVGGNISSTTINNYTGTGQLNWTGTRIELPSDIDPSIVTLLQSMEPGSRIKFTNYMYGTFNVATVTYVMPTGTGQYEVFVDTDTNSFGYGSINGTSVNGTTIEQTIPTATYGFGTDGALSSSTVKALNQTGSFTTITPSGISLVSADGSALLGSAQISERFISQSNVVFGTQADGGFVHRQVFGGKTSATNPFFNVVLPEAASLDGDISIIEVTVSAINVDTSATPPTLKAKSWKISGYATKLDNNITFSPIGQGTVIVDVNASTTGVSASLSLPAGNSPTLQCTDTDAAPLEWTWGGEYTITTTHVLVPGAGGGK